MVILSLAEGHSADVIAAVLRISVESVRLWFIAFMHEDVEGLRALKPSGRPSKLTKTQKTELDEIVTKGPVNAGYPGACWRSPMIQDLICQRYEILYSVNYICQLLKNMGFSFQKSKFVADHKDPDKREEWLKTTWNEILLQAKQRKALILFGDEASFPQWGTLTYTWAKRGQQPTVKTSGIRKGYKVFGLIEYFSGKFFFKGQEERLNSDTYTQFLREVLNQTDKHLILIQDGARYHTSKAMQEFFDQHSERLTVYKLPSYSPDYNPIEKLWKKIKQDGTHLHYFPTFEALVGKVNQILPFFKNSRQQWVQQIMILLKEINKATHEAGGSLDALLSQQYRKRYWDLLEEAERECPAPDESERKGKRGKLARSKARNLLERLRNFEGDILRFMYEMEVPFSNNQAENDLRMSKVQQKISGRFHSEDGAKIFCQIRSYLSICRKQGLTASEALRLLFAGKWPPFMVEA